MTFYNVISALLFIGSLRVLLSFIELGRLSDAIGATVLVALVFNDMLSTSWAVECDKDVAYTIRLMTIDLVNFGLLALAMIVISPTEHLFDIDLPVVAHRLGSPHSFWVFLALYWIGLMCWTKAAQASPDSSPLFALRLSIVMAFIFQGAVGVFFSPVVAAVCKVIVLTYLVIYLTWLRHQVSLGLAPRPEPVEGPAHSGNSAEGRDEASS